MQNESELKEMVKQKYSEIALQNKATNEASCCGSGCCSTEVYRIMSDDYTALEGYRSEADLGLGCGLPTQFAQIKPGNTVIDLGSGAGNDCFIARAEAGESGKIIGIDFTPAMIENARRNAEKLGFQNVTFIQADIENLPLPAETADVVISNCVLNLVPNKKAVFEQIFKVLKPGGHFSISDVVLKGSLPEGLQKNAEMYAGCVAGAIQKETYWHLIEEAGFKNIFIQKEKAIELPLDILKKYLTENELIHFRNEHSGIFSITVYAEKPTHAATPHVAHK
jgi:SAM-dependent methyltransferase